MSALQAAQWQYDNQLPPEVEDLDEAIGAWIEQQASQLAKGYRVSWGYRGETGEFTQADLARVVQQHLNQRQIDGLDQEDLFGQLVLANLGIGSRLFALDLSIKLIGGKDAVKEIAADMLRPVAEKAVLAERERQREIAECGF